MFHYKIINPLNITYDIRCICLAGIVGGVLGGLVAVAVAAAVVIFFKKKMKGTAYF